MSLLEKAKQVMPAHRYGKEYQDLALAWLFGEVTSGQVSAALKIKESSRGSIYCFLATALRSAAIAKKLQRML